MSRFLRDLIEDDHDDKPWGPVIAASLLVNLVTFSGLLLTSAAGCFSRFRTQEQNASFWAKMQSLMIPSFAAGALLATVVFLLIPEAFELLSGGHGEEHGEEHEEEHEGERWLEEHEEEEEEEAQWRFGVAFLSGFLFPILIGAIFPPPDVSQCDECVADPTAAELTGSSSLERSNSMPKALDEGCDSEECENNCHEEAVKESPEQTITAQHHKDSAVNWALATSILVGDGFHNFTDGIFIGTAFMLCSKDIAYTIVATTVYHELAQEIADYALLTHHCGMSIKQALTLNFLSGFSVMLGAVIVVGLDLSDTLLGSLLSVSAGVYIYISATECVPRIQAARKSAKDTLLFLACFIVGAVPIGLVLLNHGHCEGGHDEDHEEDERL